MFTLGSAFLSLAFCGGAATISDDTSDTAIDGDSDAPVEVPWRVVSCHSAWSTEGPGACDSISAEILADEAAMDDWIATVLQPDNPMSFDVSWESEVALVGWLACDQLGRELELKGLWSDDSDALLADYEVRVPEFGNDSPTVIYCVTAIDEAGSWTDLSATLTEQAI